MIKILITILIFCIFITGCTAPKTTDIVVTTKSVPVSEAQFTVKPASGNPADGLDLTPSLPPVENTITWKENSPTNPYLKGEVYAPVSSYFPEKPNNHYTPFVSNYISY
jgi:hypothetical protein